VSNVLDNKVNNVILEAKGITKVFLKAGGEEFCALRDVNFDVYEGEFLSCVGPSGCGKTTILRILAGLEVPTQGVISLGGKAFKSGLPPEERKHFGFVFQMPNLLEWRTLKKNVAFPLEILGVSKNEDYEARVSSLLELVGLQDFANAYPYELSGGMQQRAGIARALVHNPDILLMDEPFGALDAITREELNFELLSIWEKQRKTIIFITHNIGEAVLLSNRVLVMSPARVIGEVEIDIPRPRTRETLKDNRYFEYIEEIKGLIGKYYNI